MLRGIFDHWPRQESCISLSFQGRTEHRTPLVCDVIVHLKLTLPLTTTTTTTTNTNTNERNERKQVQHENTLVCAANAGRFTPQCSHPHLGSGRVFWFSVITLAIFMKISESPSVRSGCHRLAFTPDDVIRRAHVSRKRENHRPPHREIPDRLLRLPPFEGVGAGGSNHLSITSGRFSGWEGFSVFTGKRSVCFGCASFGKFLFANADNRVGIARTGAT